MIGDVFAALQIGALSVFLTTQLGGEQIGLALLFTVAPASLIAGLIGIWGSRYYKGDVEKQGTTARRSGTIVASTSAQRGVREILPVPSRASSPRGR